MKVPIKQIFRIKLKAGIKLNVGIKLKEFGLNSMNWD